MTNRLAKVLLTPATFGAPCREERVLLFEYDSSKNFNIDPPPRQARLAVVADVLLKTIDHSGHRPLTETEQAMAKKWPEGWAEKDCAHYVPGWERVEKLAMRLSWLVPVYGGTQIHKCLHPSQDRLLSLEEQALIRGDLLIETWSARQRDLDWEEDDWESSFSAADNEWYGGDTPGKAVKVFDMREFRGFIFDEEHYSGKLPNRRRHLINGKLLKR